VNVPKKVKEQNTLITDRILKVNERVKLSHSVMKMHLVDVCTCMYIAMNFITICVLTNVVQNVHCNKFMMICMLTNSVQNKHCNKLYQDV